ncbi:hypothetical protein AB834_04150 [PVC group bacterium (ex Bugula neritina AB1)]|nr:hypothetical protein AB834_04150 [PVC group bacterium (ex Bugula neritina AB1)]
MFIFSINGKKGFTLLETLAVISVMVILIGIILPSLRSSRLRAFQAKTEAKMVSLALAIKMYASDMGALPDDLTSGCLGDGDQEMIRNSRWKGPYLDLKEDDKNESGQILDSWGRPFRYGKGEGRKKFTFDLFSLGLDGQEGTEDDLRY